MTEKITVLSEIEHIRQRSGMYIGLTENPLHLCYELIDNALDEANAENAKNINLWISKNHFSIIDDGRGIPLHDLNGEVAAIVTCTKLFSGAKFDKHAYKISIGLNGVGLVAVNALSTSMELVVCRDKKKLTATFSKGVLQKKSIQKSVDEVKKSYTKIDFEADPEIFESTNLEPLVPIIEKRLRLAKTALDCNIFFQSSEVKPYTNEELIGCTVLTAHKSKTHELMVLGYKLESTNEDINNGAVNLLPVDRGTHIQSLKKIIQEAWSPFIKDRNIRPADVLIGCSAFISVIVDEPKYSSQTKEQLSSSNPVRLETYKEFVDAIRNYLAGHENQRNILLRKFEDYRASLDRLSSTAYINSVIKLGELDGENVSRNSSVPKLLDCSSPKRDFTELYIVEGASAKGPLKSTRNSSIHAILPLKGKILNVIDRDIVSIMDNDEVRSIINGIGAGAYSKFDITRIRYGKIIIMTDADQDGLNILALLIGLFNYAMPELISAGHLYYAQMPLYGYYDKKFIPVYSEKDLPPKIKSFQRFKGLGEMNPDQIKEIAFVETVRKLVQVTDPDKEVTKLVGGSFLKRKLLVDNGILQ
jgi:DNA gyrase subunit B